MYRLIIIMSQPVDNKLTLKWAWSWSRAQL